MNRLKQIDQLEVHKIPITKSTWEKPFPGWGKWKLGTHINFNHPAENWGVCCTFVSLVKNPGGPWHICRGWEPSFGISPISWKIIIPYIIFGTIRRWKGNIIHRIWMIKH